MCVFSIFQTPQSKIAWLKKSRKGQELELSGAIHRKLEKKDGEIIPP